MIILTGVFQSLTQSVAGRIILFAIAAGVAAALVTIALGWEKPAILLLANLPKVIGAG